MSKIVTVYCFVFPNAKTYWIREDECKNPNKIVERWWELNPDYEGCTMGMVVVDMPENKYYQIPATVESLILEGDYNEGK